MLVYYEQIMNHYIQSANTYVTDHKKQFTLGAIITTVVVVVVILVALFIYNDPSSKIVYKPAKACDLLTPTKAQALLGDKVIGLDSKAPVITDNVATSKCSYTDSNTDVNNLIVAAIAVRTGINDAGIKQNKNEFNANKPSDNIEAVKDIGDTAYFDHSTGQLNILKGHDWIILSYGVGATPEANTSDKAFELAHMVLD
ncbi:MAG: hypothetical protein JWP85_2830 [Rhodoglobus sp.]|nr:hypothetical protein [Rhodoglobus sp.]